VTILQNGATTFCRTTLTRITFSRMELHAF
jgi:hypothetical protein